MPCVVVKAWTWKAVHERGAEVDKRPCSVSWGMHVFPRRHPSLMESFWGGLDIAPTC